MMISIGVAILGAFIGVMIGTGLLILWITRD